MQNVQWPLPWQQSQWHILQQRKNQTQLPHALLFNGVEGIGKLQFARQFAHSLLCTQADAQGLPCFNCRNCDLITAHTHPDLIEIQPEKTERGTIKVDTIRTLTNFCNKTAGLNQYKIIMIHPAHALNIHAANALLKTLEEPPAKTLFLLITDHLMFLPATIRSRCQIIHFAAPQTECATAWLEAEIGHAADYEHIPLLLSLAQGAPLKALTLQTEQALDFRQSLFEDFQSIIKTPSQLTQIAESWAKQNISKILVHLKSWITDIIRLKYVIEEPSVLINIDFEKSLSAMGTRCTLKRLYPFLDELNRLDNAFKKGANFNIQLTLENLLLQWLSVIYGTR